MSAAGIASVGEIGACAECAPASRPQASGRWPCVQQPCFIPRLDPAFLCLGSAALIRHGVRTLLLVSDAESPTTFQTASPSPANLCVARCSLPRLLP